MYITIMIFYLLTDLNLSWIIHDGISDLHGHPVMLGREWNGEGSLRAPKMRPPAFGPYSIMKLCSIKSEINFEIIILIH